MNMSTRTLLISLSCVNEITFEMHVVRILCFSFNVFDRTDMYVFLLMHIENLFFSYSINDEQIDSERRSRISHCIDRIKEKRILLIKQTREKKNERERERVKIKGKKNKQSFIPSSVQTNMAPTTSDKQPRKKKKKKTTTKTTTMKYSIPHQMTHTKMIKTME
jgi:hypothetical protein